MLRSEVRKASISINEVYPSIQGEGLLGGLPSLFIRIQGCNLRCPWCDQPAAHPQKLPYARGTTVFAISSEATQKKRQSIVNYDQYAKLVLGRADIPTQAKVGLADLAMDVTLNESVVFGSKLAKVIRRELGRDVHFRGILRAS